MAVDQRTRSGSARLSGSKHQDVALGVIFVAHAHGAQARLDTLDGCLSAV